MSAHYKKNHGTSAFENTDVSIELKKILVYTNSNNKLPINFNRVLKSKLLSLYFEHSLFYEMINTNSIYSDQTMIKYIKNPKTVVRVKGKTPVGDDQLGDFEFEETVVINFEQPLIQTAIVSIADLRYELQLYVEEKMRKMMERMKYDYEMYAFNKVENSIKEDKVIEFYFDEKHSGRVSPLSRKELMEQLRLLLIQTSTKLTQTQDMKQGINALDTEDIIVFVKPLVLDYMSEAGLLGDKMSQTFAEGSKLVTKIGSYTIRSNRYLRKYDAIITTNFAGAGQVSLLDANFRNLRDANHLGIYLEYCYAAGMLYNDITFGVKIGETRPKVVAETKSEVITNVENTESTVD